MRRSADPTEPVLTPADEEPKPCDPDRMFVEVGIDGIEDNGTEGCMAETENKQNEQWNDRSCFQESTIEHR